VFSAGVDGVYNYEFILLWGVWIVFLPLLLILSSGSGFVVGLAVILADVFIARQLGKRTLSVQRRAGIPEPLIGFLALGVVFVSCAVLHGLLAFGILKSAHWFR
jgi:hypothetical protein